MRLLPKLAFSMALLTCLSPLTSLTAMAHGITLQESTRLFVRNATAAEVTCMVVVPAPGGAIEQDGCPTTVKDLRIEDAAHQVLRLEQYFTGTQGWFNLPAGHMVELINEKVDPYTGQQNFCLQGLVLGFGQFGNSCPGNTLQTVPSFPDTRPGPGFNQPVSPPHLIPNGSNSFEPTLNVPHKIKNAPGGGSTEAIDISCVNGVNCTLHVTVTPPAGGPFWHYDGGSKAGGDKTFTTATTFQNSWLNFSAKCDNNCVDPGTGLPRPGIYPYGCTQCNIFPDPAPPCPAPAQFCAVQNGLPPNTGCGFNRGPLGNARFGGEIEVTYMGPLAPPPSCN